MRFFYFAFILVLVSCSTKTKNEGEKLSHLFHSYWEEHNRFFPLDATQQGDNRYNHLLPDDQTAAYREELKRYYSGYLSRLNKFDVKSLSDNDRVSYDIFKYEMEMQLEGLNTELWQIPFQQFWGLPLSLAQLGSGKLFQPFKTVKDYENWVQRVAGFTPWTNSAIENFRAGMRSGVVLPRILVRKMITQMKELISPDVSKSVFYQPVSDFPPGFSEADQARLTLTYRNMIRDLVNPNYLKLHDFLKNEYLPRARDTHGIGSIPNGEYYYDYLARSWTTTDKSPEEIYQTGLKEVERIQSEMLKVKEQVGFKGSLKSFFVHVRSDPKLMPYQTAEEVLNFFRSTHNKMQPKLSTMFGKVPKTPFEIRQTEKFREATASAEYSPGSPDGSRPGVFYLPIIDPKKFNITSGTESLFLHEAIPGHHYQTSLQQENEDLPAFRRFAWYGAMGEGWALYSESLGKELGLYTNPYHYMGALGDEMHRACRLVVDVAIHLKKMKKDEAVKYLIDHEPINEADAVMEVERYMAIPAQALSYKVGAMKIRELRNKYEKALGAKFNLRDFHDEVLKDGVMPLEILQRELNRWAGELNK